MSFLTEDKQLFRKYYGTCSKISSIINKKCDKKLIYHGKYLNNKIKYYNSKSTTNFYYTEIPLKENIHYQFY